MEVWVDRGSPFVKGLSMCVLVNDDFQPKSSNPVHGEVYSIQHYVIEFVSE
jgi:hypothetical protein